MDPVIKQDIIELATLTYCNLLLGIALGVIISWPFKAFLWRKFRDPNSCFTFIIYFLWALQYAFLYLTFPEGPHTGLWMALFIGFGFGSWVTCKNWERLGQRRTILETKNDDHFPGPFRPT